MDVRYDKAGLPSAETVYFRFVVPFRSPASSPRELTKDMGLTTFIPLQPMNVPGTSIADLHVPTQEVSMICMNASKLPQTYDTKLSRYART